MTRPVEFRDCTNGMEPVAVLHSTYHINADVCRSVAYLNVARECSKQFGLFGFWRVKGSAA
jgi:hypothetical protein